MSTMYFLQKPTLGPFTSCLISWIDIYCKTVLIRRILRPTAQVTWCFVKRQCFLLFLVPCSLFWCLCRDWPTSIPKDRNCQNFPWISNFSEQIKKIARPSHARFSYEFFCLRLGAREFHKKNYTRIDLFTVPYPATLRHIQNKFKIRAPEPRRSITGARILIF